MGAEYFRLAYMAEDEKLSVRMGKCREALTAMLAGHLMDNGGQIYLELSFLEMLLCEWVRDVSLIEARREQSAQRPSPWKDFWRRWI